MRFDIIGDIHGMIGPLKSLLTKMGYKGIHGTYKHPEGHKAVFVGDLIDRGEHGLDVIDIARSMTESDNAITVMGNHELNAIFYNLRDADNQPLRPHTEKNTHQHSAFLKQIEKDENGHQKYEEAIAWFKTLPLFYENDHFRVVHACWDEKSIKVAKPFLNEDNSLKEEHFYAAADKGDELYAAVEKLLKGDEQTLPNNLCFKDKDNHKRHEARLRWWLEDTSTFKELAMFPGSRNYVEQVTSKMPETIPENRVIYESDKLVFVGHYWLTGTPTFRSQNVCCVDYSAGKGDKLVAYRWNSDSQSDGHFIFTH